MPADTAAKRYSAMNLKSPWRRLSVVPDVLIPQGERQAAGLHMYYGILAAAPAPPVIATGFRLDRRHRPHWRPFPVAVPLFLIFFFRWLTGGH